MKTAEPPFIVSDGCLYIYYDQQLDDYKERTDEAIAALKLSPEQCRRMPLQCIPEPLRFRMMPYKKVKRENHE